VRPSTRPVFEPGQHAGFSSTAIKATDTYSRTPLFFTHFFTVSFAPFLMSTTCPHDNNPRGRNMKGGGALAPEYTHRQKYFLTIFGKGA